jgi:hypothetical protein
MRYKFYKLIKKNVLIYILSYQLKKINEVLTQVFVIKSQVSTIIDYIKIVVWIQYPKIVR